jgi:hypothetical protein
VERVLPTDTPTELQAKGIHYVLVDSGGLDLLGITINDWTNRYNGALIGTATFEALPGSTASDYLVRLNSPQNK